MRNADWKGALKKRFRWTRLRFEWGRWCFQTNCCGETIAYWWEWDSDAAIAKAKGE